MLSKAKAPITAEHLIEIAVVNGAPVEAWVSYEDHSDALVSFGSQPRGPSVRSLDWTLTPTQLSQLAAVLPTLFADALADALDHGAYEDPAIEASDIVRLVVVQRIDRLRVAEAVAADDPLKFNAQGDLVVCPSGEAQGVALDAAAAGETPRVFRVRHGRIAYRWFVAGDEREKEILWNAVQNYVAPIYGWYKTAFERLQSL